MEKMKQAGGGKRECFMMFKHKEDPLTSPRDLTEPNRTQLSRFRHSAFDSSSYPGRLAFTSTIHSLLIPYAWYPIEVPMLFHPWRISQRVVFPSPAERLRLTLRGRYHPTSRLSPIRNDWILTEVHSVERQLLDPACT